MSSLFSHCTKHSVKVHAYIILNYYFDHHITPQPYKRKKTVVEKEEYGNFIYTGCGAMYMKQISRKKIPGIPNWQDAFLMRRPQKTAELNGEFKCLPRGGRGVYSGFQVTGMIKGFFGM